ncbi:MAG: CRISPR-associated helicase Cas3' [Candidatus Freyarchaeota archaeon]
MNPSKPLDSYYTSTCSTFNWQPRHAIVNALQKMEESLSEEEPVVLLMELPTGYGKSSMSLALTMAALDGNPYFSRVIHVLPMRSIVDDLGNRLKEWLKKAGQKPELVGIQHMGVPGSPFFAKKCVVVTLDTFLLNFFKTPAYELSKLFKYDVAHFEFPRGNIYSSLLVFDEFHLLSPMASFNEESKALWTTIQSIRRAAASGVPVIIMTATMPEKIVNILKSELSQHNITIKSESYTHNDPFEAERKKKKITLTLLEGDVLTAVSDYYEEGKKTLIVLNSVKAAVNVYLTLKEKLKGEKDNLLLLHGRLPEAIKKTRSESLKDASILVATQVVESGIDESFDVLISELCPPDRLLQRMGRVARKPGHDEGEVIIVKTDVKGVYDGEILEETWQLINSISEGAAYPRPKIEEKIQNIMNKVYNKKEIEKDKYIALIKALLYLDTQPFLNMIDAKDLLRAIGGFTSSFSIVTAFSVDDVNSGRYLEYAVGLPEKMAKDVLKQEKMVVENGCVKNLSPKELNILLRSPFLSLKLMEEGYEGIAIKEISKEIGYVGVTA